MFFSLLSRRSAAGQHPQRSAAHHHPHGHLCLPARPAAVAELDQPGASRECCVPPGSSTWSPPSQHRFSPAGSPVWYPASRHCSGPARFSPPVSTVLPPLPTAAGDALRMRVWLFTPLCPCCITWLHCDVASNKGLAGCWKSPPPSANRLLELPGVCTQRTRLARSRGWSNAPASQIPAFWRG